MKINHLSHVCIHKVPQTVNRGGVGIILNVIKRYIHNLSHRCIHKVPQTVNRGGVGIILNEIK